MKLVLQIVDNASIKVNDELISNIDRGLVAYFCAEIGDSEEDLNYLAKKIASLRIFPDVNGKTNLSVKDISGEVLLISQFTLSGDYNHGNRPSFINAMDPTSAKLMYEKLAQILKTNHVFCQFVRHEVVNF